MIENPHITHVVASLSEDELKVFFNILHKWPINFAWSDAYMLGLYPDLLVYYLAIDPNAKPVKQKLRKMHPRIALLVKAELEKLLEVKFIHPIDYSKCISNMVPVSKPCGEIKVCIDFRDLNKACPKDDFPLPNINILIDLTRGHDMLSLMDGLSCYNQIRIAKEDHHKTNFTTPWGTFCYHLFSFCLKNAGATYQCVMTVIFLNLMHTVMEDNVDDILVKSKTRAEHPVVLELFFEHLAKYKL